MSQSVELVYTKYCISAEILQRYNEGVWTSFTTLFVSFICARFLFSFRNVTSGLRSPSLLACPGVNRAAVNVVLMARQFPNTYTSTPGHESSTTAF